MSRGGNSGGNRNSLSLIYSVTTTVNTPSSPTISLLSSSSSSPTSSPSQLAAAANMLTVRSNEKTKANPLSNISSSLAKHQQPQPSLTNGKTNNKLVSVTLDNSGLKYSSRLAESLFEKKSDGPENDSLNKTRDFIA
jgi:hypothetical protein